ncbi:rhodanese-like domain-containing protein [Bowmanella denitrificans]|uniref:Rhodanese-like domain-containing protein n=1 Tax=Bowmanella denitrificans TaxID=366582 RepID=A0ABN0XKK2_9ALTE
MTPSEVMRIPAAAPQEAQRHFAAKLAFETDCADVQEAMKKEQPDFVLLDVRGPNAYAREHVPGAMNLPRTQMSPAVLQDLCAGKAFVVYCAGPHCNGADKAAELIARFGFQVKIMIGGVEGWRDEKFGFASL